VRESGYAFHAKDGVVQEIYGAEDVRELIRTLGVTHYVTPAADNAVKGVVAYKGVARGKVVIVRTHEDAEHVERGDILIASMTTPELLGGMYRAAAFVTDEGGVTCHAAIIARELKKPCIVGTRTATRAFKTGDVVEVDAQKGEVRIIQRAQNDLAHELSPARCDYVGLYKSPVFAAWFWCAWPQTDLVARAELPSAFYGYLAVRGGHACWTQDMKRALLAFIREKLAHDPGYFARMTQVAQEVFDEGIAFAKGISPDAPLLETFRELVRHRTRMQFFWAIGATMSYYFVDMLLAESAAESGIPESEIVFHLPKMQTPMLDIEQHARELRSQLAEAGIAGDIPAVAAAIRSSKELHASFDAFIREYDWIQETNWIGAPAELEDVLSLVCKEPHEDTHAALHAETPRFTEVAAASGHIGFWRQAGCEYCSIFEMRVRPLLERIANEAGMSYRELLRCSPEEIMSTQNLADLKAIAARRADDTSATVTREKGSVLVIDSDTSITSLSDALIPSADTNQKELRGEVGYKGHARGTARIIIAREDFHRFQDGDVLVAPMTTPDYVILMQRASAIVTNMGGLLCHAAIVSRELKKPCVIGTKVATQVLKDGDLVEVDAEKGVVRVVERATV
jgi:phosphohistidine swiveling domain-containing protein